MSIKIGITGGIGSGKSVVSRLLEVMNIPVYISDVESKRLTQLDPHIRQELCALLGDDVYCNGELNKPLLGAYLFGDPAHARVINGIIHPRVKADFRSWVLTQAASEWVGMESAILCEAGFESEVDVLVVVYAPIELRIDRVMKRDHTSREEVLKRMASQMSDEEKVKRADFTIFNDGETPLIPQVLELITFLSKKKKLPLPCKKNN